MSTLPITTRVVMAHGRLDSTPSAQRGLDWVIAKALVTEAGKHLWPDVEQAQAEAALIRAKPFIEVAAP